LKDRILHSYGADTEAQASTPDYARIVNDRHHARVQGLLEDSIAKGGKLVVGGGIKGDGENFIAPTVVSDVDKNSKIMEQEI
ncbi:MAG: aldehyde dehydrogenase family protein, partial [Nevskiales bacterium]